MFKRYKDYIILKEPVPYPLNDYEEVKDKLVNMFKNHPDIVTIYQIGSVSILGISDLDLSLVFNDHAQNIDFRNYYNKLNGRDRYILMHSPFIITKSLFENMRYFYIPGDFKLLWGEQLEIQPIKLIKLIAPIQPIKLLEQLICAEFILGTLFSILRALETRVIKIRSLLCGLNTVKYDLEVLGLNKENFPIGWQLVDTVSQIRQNWFDLSEEIKMTDLIDCLARCPGILFDVLNFINKKLNTFEIEFFGENTNQIKFGINAYVVKSLNSKCKSHISKTFLISLLTKRLPYSKLLDDASLALSDYIIKIPQYLFHLLSGNINSNFKSIFEYRNNLIKSYLLFYKKITGFGMLIPTLRAPLPILNLKWRGLTALRRLMNK